MSRMLFSWMTLAGQTMFCLTLQGDVLDLWCIIDRFGVNKYLTCAMPIIVGLLGEPIVAKAAEQDWHDRGASTH